jgi:hypothetical protein
VGMITDGTGSALSDAKAALDEAKANLRSAYDEEKRAVEQVISRHQALIKSLRNFLDDLRLDSNLSPLDPFERFQEAQKQFQDTAAKALSGDEDAIGKLEDASRAYLTEAKAWWGTSTQYFEVFKEVEAIVAQALSVSEGQLSEAERQLAALDEQIAALIDIDIAVKSVSDAIADLTKAEQDYEAAKLANDAYQNSLFEQMLALMAEQRDALGDVAASMAYLNANMDVMNAIGAGQDFGTGSTDIGVLANAHWEQFGQYENRDVGLGAQSRGAKYLANNPDVLESIKGGQNFGTGLTDLDTLARVHWEAFGQYENRKKGYQSGGFTGFGATNAVAGVVHGQEFVAHAEATRRWRPQLEAMNAGSFNQGGGDNSALIAEIRALREQVASSERSNVQVTAAGAQAQVAATASTTQAVNRQSEETRRAQHRRTG